MRGKGPPVTQKAVLALACRPPSPLPNVSSAPHRLHANLVLAALPSSMSPEIKFTSFGIPYLVEFANVTFRRKKRASMRPKSNQTVYSSAQFSDSDWTLATLSSDTLAYPVPDKNETEGQGLYIRLASQTPSPTRTGPLSASRALRLKHRIARAVVSAGMDYAPDAAAAEPLDGALRARGALPPVPVSSLYRGTYGQVMAAFAAAGLTTSVCDESGFPDGACAALPREGAADVCLRFAATRLGAMFVVNATASGAVEFTKITLYA